MELAARLVERPLMSNLSRGLWGYHGRTPGGRELTVQATGIGGPSTAIVLEELAALGVRRAVRIGTCRALDPALEPGAAIVVGAALPFDGLGTRLCAGVPAKPDPELTVALERAVGTGAVAVASTDLYRDPEDESRRRRWLEAGAHAVELSTAALFSLAGRLGVTIACGLVVTAGATGEQLDDASADRTALALGEAAAEALVEGTQSPLSATPRLP